MENTEESFRLKLEFLKAHFNVLHNTIKTKQNIATVTQRSLCLFLQNCVQCCFVSYRDTGFDPLTSE